VNISTKFTSPNFTPGVIGRIQGIVLHSTEGNFPGCAYWLCNPAAQASAHYIVTRAGELYRLVPDQHVAWHAGHSWGNNHTIGIEIEHIEGQDYPAVQMAAVEWLCRDLISRYSIPQGNIKAHRWLTPQTRRDPTDWPDAALRTWIAALYASPGQPSQRRVPHWYHVHTTANVRTDPIFAENIVAVLAPGSRVHINTFGEGAAAGTNNEWGQLSEGLLWIHSSTIQAE